MLSTRMRMAAAGYVPAASGDFWTAGGATGCVAAYQPKGAASYAASRVNLANPGTYDAGEVGGGAVNWSLAVGWSGFSSLSRCLDVGVAPQYTWTFIVRFSGVTGNSTVICGCYESGSTGGYIAYYTAGMSSYLRGGGATIAPGMSAGVYAVAGNQAYRNGNIDGSSWSQTTSAISRTMYIGAQHYTSATQFINGSIQAFAIYDNTLTADEVAAVSAAMAAL